MQQRNRVTTADMGRKFRKIFFIVLEVHNQIRGTIGNSPAIDYEQAYTGKPKYKNDVSFLRVIDYTADVCKAVRDTVDAEDQAIFAARYQDQPSDSGDVSTTELMKLQERLGRVFLARHLYPIKQYFQGYREKAA